jgi:uncharacterized protein YqjF (DUF2071 family)
MWSALESAARQSRSIEETEHRPWPAAKGLWLLGQSWLDLLFAHWPVERAELEPHVPAPLELETFDGQAWITISPFLVEALRLPATPPLPVLSRFPELNVRTYVTYEGSLASGFSRSMQAAVQRSSELGGSTDCRTSTPR